MNLKELLEFKRYISSQTIDLENDSNGLTLQDLFKKFSEYEIHSKKDYKFVVTRFKTTMSHLFKHINTSEEIEKETFVNKLNIFCRNIHNSLNPTQACLQKQEPFVSVIKSLIPENSAILDVGAGVIPHSSFMLAPGFSQVHTMDKFAICEKALEPFDVKAKDGYFDATTSVDNVDFIVGNRPCSAIKNIVQQAVQNNKGYVIKLCDCDLTNIATQTGLYKNC